MWNSGGGGGGGNRGFISGGGRGRSTGTFRGGRGRGFGRGSSSDNATTNGGTGEQPLLQTCIYYARGGSCRIGDSCRFRHVAVSIFSPQAHQAPIKALDVMHMGDVPKILTGSSDRTVSVWNLAASSTDQPVAEATLNTTGAVTHIEVKDTTILWAVDEPVAPDQSITVGTVHLLNNSDLSTLPVKRSEEMPYTSPFGEIRSFVVAVLEGVTYLITAGAEGVIRSWRFDPAASKFEHLSVLEGHVRAVTSLLLQDNLLWSGSLDCTLRVWDLSSGRCVGSLSSSNHGPGHSQAVTCLCSIPSSAANPEPYVASGGADNEVKLWKTNGEFAVSVPHQAAVTALAVFQDDQGGVQSLVVGLADGFIQVRACSNMALIFSLDSSIHRTRTVWGIKFLGKSCFATAGEDGALLVWKVSCALPDKV